MDNPKMFVLNKHYVTLFLYRKMVLFFGVFGVLFRGFLLPLFGFVLRNLFRLHGNSFKCSDKESVKLGCDDSNCIDQNPEPEKIQEIESKLDSIEIIELDENYDDNDESSKEESPKCFLQYKFNTYEDFSNSFREDSDSSSTQVNKYEFMSGRDDGDDESSKEESPKCSLQFKFNKYEFMSNRDSSGLMEEPKVGNYTVADSCLDSKDEILNDGLVLKDDFMDRNLEFVDVVDELQKKAIDQDVNFDVENSCSDLKDEIVNDGLLFEDDFMDKKSELAAGGLSNDEKVSNEVDSDSVSITTRDECSVINHFTGVASDEFLSDKDFGGEFEHGFDENYEEIMKELQKLEETNIGIEHNKFDEDDDEMMEELQDLNSESLSEKNFDGNNNASKFSDSEDPNGLELWEHQDLIEQLKMEIKKVRAIGLPTILEESESPKFMEDLQPWKVDERFQHEDTLEQLHKFYKTYKERMRKLDILNYQKMYALGVMQSKDPLQSVSSSSKSFRFLKPNKKVEPDLTNRLIEELYSDLEMVYVAQMCLSWEFLYWQYEKALELWESDLRCTREYNEVAGEFQQFQVLMQRFMEDEAFQGPRVQNYVKNRCALRNFGQVPVIREDYMKDKRKGKRRRDESTITSDMLIEIMEECIRVFWRFVRADKHESNTIFTGHKSTYRELQDPADSKLFIEVRLTLQKKEKMLKDILRTGNCILKRFQKHREESSDQVLFFFSQVDMKLVSRVLNMSKITSEQLVWCLNKLSRISFVNRKIRVETSFLLFPCS